MKTPCVTIDSRMLSPHDRYVLSYWCGMSLPRSGDVTIPVKNEVQRASLHVMLEILGKGKATV